MQIDKILKNYNILLFNIYKGVHDNLGYRKNRWFQFLAITQGVI